MAEKTVAAPEEQNEGATSREGTRADARYVAPPADIYETPDGLVLLADLPGVKSEDLDIQVKDDILTINARASAEMPGNAIYREFELLSFFRQFQLSDIVDADRISAEFRHGVLKLTLPKAESAMPRRIAVAMG